MALVAGNLIKATGAHGADDAGVIAANTVAVPSAFAADASAIPWVCRVRAADIAGADGASITSFTSSDSNARSFAGTGTLRTGSNGIGGQNALGFNGSSNAYSTSAGGASLTGDWYAYAVCQWSSLTGYQNVLSWGDSSPNGARRSMMKFAGSPAVPANGFCFVGQYADLRPPFAISSGTPYLLEVAYFSASGRLTLWANGFQVASAAALGSSGYQYQSLVAYASAALNLGQNPAGGELFAGLLAEAAWLGSYPTAAQRYVVRTYAAALYGISVQTVGALGVILAGNAAAPVEAVVAGDSVVVGGNSPLAVGYTGAVGAAGANYSFCGAVAAHAFQANHLFSSDFAEQNVGQVWSKNASGWSCWTYCEVGPSGGQERGAAGVGAHSVFPWSGPNGSYFVEYSNFTNTSLWGDGREVQTLATGTYCLRRRVRDDTQAIEQYDMTAAEPSVGGPTAGLVSLQGRPVTTVANNGTLDTNITTGATQCGLVVVKDATNAACAVYRLENATLTAVSANSEFSTASGTSGKVNVFNNSGQIRLENKTGGSLNLTAAYYGA